MENFKFLSELYRTASVFDTFIDQAIVPKVGITRAQFTVLILIDSFPGSTKAELARLLSNSHVAVGRLVGILIERRYIKEQASKQNIHSTQLFVTNEGGEMVACVSTIFERESAALFASVAENINITLLRSQLASLSKAALEARLKLSDNKELR